MKDAKKLISLFVGLLAVTFGGCSSLENTTPESMPESPSRTYTLSMKATVNDGDVDEASLKPFIVIDGAMQPMKAVGKGVYQYDYVLPRGRDGAKYYFQLDYDVIKNASGIPAARSLKSPEVYEFKTQAKFVVNMESSRGNVGSRITLLGKGFDVEDKVLLGGVEAKTDFVSSTTLNFTVPSLESGKTYPIELASADGKIKIGDFRVDDATLGVSPRYIELTSGSTTDITFNIGFKAPAEGYVIDIKTNVPSSLIMDDVVVPAGKRSVTVPLKAGAKGNGFIYINAFGFKEVVIPFIVR